MYVNIKIIPAGTVPGIGRGDRGEWWRGWIQVNIKIIPAETVPGIGRGDRGEWWRGWIQVWCTGCIIRTFVNPMMYPHPAQQYKKQKKTGKN
jgi:hypothetical protein